MANDADLPWSEQADLFISEIDQTIKSEPSLRNFLLNPDEDAKVKELAAQVAVIKTAVTKYFDSLEDEMQDEKQALERELEQKDIQYTRIDGVISSKAAIGRVPYMKPVSLDFNQDNAEEITIEQYDSNVDALIVKMLNISNYVANVSGSYSKYTLGSWVFSGAKSYILTINPPSSPVVVIEGSRDEINNMIDVTSSRLDLPKSK